MRRKEIERIEVKIQRLTGKREKLKAAERDSSRVNKVSWLRVFKIFGWKIVIVKRSARPIDEVPSVPRIVSFSREEDTGKV